LNPPPAVIQWEQILFHQQIRVIAHADISGNTVTWNNSILDGSNFGVDPANQNAGLTWNLSNVEGSMFLYLIVGNPNIDPNLERANLYQVSLDSIINGNAFVTLDGLTRIDELNFFGRVNLPDEANTGALLLFAVSAVLLTYEARRRRNA
jgi:hypothetical protein